MSVIDIQIYQDWTEDGYVFKKVEPEAEPADGCAGASHNMKLKKGKGFVLRGRVDSGKPAKSIRTRRLMRREKPSDDGDGDAGLECRELRDRRERRYWREELSAAKSRARARAQWWERADAPHAHRLADASAGHDGSALVTSVTSRERRMLGGSYVEHVARIECAPSDPASPEFEDEIKMAVHPGDNVEWPEAVIRRGMVLRVEVPVFLTIDERAD